MNIKSENTPDTSHTLKIKYKISLFFLPELEKDYLGRIAGKTQSSPPNSGKPSNRSNSSWSWPNSCYYWLSFATNSSNLPICTPCTPFQTPPLPPPCSSRRKRRSWSKTEAGSRETSRRDRSIGATSRDSTIRPDLLERRGGGRRRWRSRDPGGTSRTRSPASSASSTRFLHRGSEWRGGRWWSWESRPGCCSRETPLEMVIARSTADSGFNPREKTKKKWRDETRLWELGDGSRRIL